MNAESGWAVAIGIAVGILAWVVGAGEALWPQHPYLVILFLMAVAALVSSLLLNRNTSAIRAVHQK